MNFLDILFPKRCVGCGSFGRYICSRCIKSARLIDTPFCPVCEKPAIDGVTHPRCQNRYTIDGLTSFFRYDGVIAKAIKSVKYRFVSDLAAECVALVSDTQWIELMEMTKLSCIVPIPLHVSRLRFRGFNQAEVLGSCIAKCLRIPMRVDILRRTRKTTPQVEMKDRKKRESNMEKAFGLSPGYTGVVGTRVLLVDDVFTTGATMRAAANKLKRGGATYVWGLTIAR